MLAEREKVLLVAAISIAFLAWKPLVDPIPRLLWNASASVPIGLYWIENHSPNQGDIGVLQLPEWAALIASERQYLRRGAWLLKPIAASKGDLVCRFDAYVFVNGKLVARALLADKKHRPMPQWRGCMTLKSEQVFLLSKRKDSFDSRYFGPVDRASIAGTAKPMLLFGW
jgi:conjugative transfer signal peptidase TraF